MVVMCIRAEGDYVPYVIVPKSTPDPVGAEQQIL